AGLVKGRATVTMNQGYVIQWMKSTLGGPQQYVDMRKPLISKRDLAPTGVTLMVVACPLSMMVRASLQGDVGLWH
ncbi:hypothetical protein AVEN_87097-1, partial [Araneus ventricosus]